MKRERIKKSEKWRILLEKILISESESLKHHSRQNKFMSNEDEYSFRISSSFLTAKNKVLYHLSLVNINRVLLPM